MREFESTLVLSIIGRIFNAAVLGCAPVQHLVAGPARKGLRHNTEPRPLVKERGSVLGIVRDLSARAC